MPLKIVADRNKKTKNLYIRASYLGIAVDKSCRTDRRSARPLADLDVFSLSPLRPSRLLHMFQIRTSVVGRRPLILFDERHRGAYWRRIGLPAFRSRTS